MIRRWVVLALAAALVLVTAPTVTTALVADPVEEPSDIRASVDDVLSRPAYTGVGQNPVSNLLRSNPVSQWIGEQIQRFINWLSGFGGSDPSVPGVERDPRRTSGLVSILILTVILAIAVSYVLASRRDRDDASSDARDDEAALSQAELIRRARRAEETGDYEGAVRLRFRAGLDALDSAGAIEVSPSTATGTVRRIVSLDEFDSVANVFEAATYSEYQATSVDAEAARRGWDDVFRVLDRSDNAE